MIIIILDLIVPQALIQPPDLLVHLAVFHLDPVDLVLVVLDHLGVQRGDVALRVQEVSGVRLPGGDRGERFLPKVVLLRGQDVG